MCGITGFLSPLGIESKENATRLVSQMTNSLLHRGPDAGGVWIDENSGIALGHRRLSIIDLSPSGHQPMLSNSGRYVIVFNGEIYNFLELRRDLENKYMFKGTSDTEVLLASIDAWGIHKAINRSVGMFAVALWDRKECSLYLIRDRIGEKPLYYGWMGKSFLFGSELKALSHHPDWQSEINVDALALYFRYGYISSPYSIYKNIFKLSAGTMIKIDRITKPGFRPNEIIYWSSKIVAEEGCGNQLTLSIQDIESELEALLKKSVKQQMISDVPLGVFLSGGVDSSLIAALMQTQSSSAIKTFTIGFNEPDYNEAEHAKLIANYLGTDHTELYMQPKEALDVIPLIPQLYDEPFCDSSQLPTFLVSKLAKQNVTVCLSGDGGDELFGGYHEKYDFSQNVWSKINWVPYKLRSLMSKIIVLPSPDFWDQVFNVISLNSSNRIKTKWLTGDRVSIFADILRSSDSEEINDIWISHWKNTSHLVTNSILPSNVYNDSNTWPNFSNFYQRMMYFDMITYLPDDILVKVDRAAMGVSLETRIPILNHHVVEYAWKIPLELKVHNGKGKWILRNILSKYIPEKLYDRPKKGFSLPIGKWLLGPLRDWAEDLLDEKELAEQGLLNVPLVIEKWNSHKAENRDSSRYLWSVLMFQSWYREYYNNTRISNAK